MTYRAWQCRPFVDCQRDLQRIRDAWLLDDPEEDVSRGEQRLAAEVALNVIHARDVPNYAHERAYQILKVMAQQ